MLTLACALSLTAAHAQIRVVYPNLEEREGYGYSILALALEKSGVDYTLEIYGKRINMERAKYLLDRGDISVIDLGTSAEFESRWDAVYFPIDRGLSGYRLMFVNEELLPAFAAIRDVRTLSGYSAAQGTDWADTAILRHAGIDVLESARFDTLFKMVDARRVDFFPLGVEEIGTFRDRYADLLTHTAIEPTMALHYPFARLYFVRKGNTELETAILRGLERAFADGSFQRMFAGDPGVVKSLGIANLGNRRILEMENPYMSDRFKAIPGEYFYSPK